MVSIGWYTLREVATKVGISYASACYWVRRGVLVPDQKLGRANLFSEETVRAFDPAITKGRNRSRPALFSSEMMTMREAALFLDVPLRWLRNAVARGDVTVDGKLSGAHYLLRSTVNQLSHNPSLLKPQRVGRRDPTE